MKRNKLIGCVALCALYMSAFAEVMPDARSSAHESSCGVPDTIKEVTVVGKTHNVITSTAPLYRLNSQEVNRLGITDISDAMRRLPGVTLRDYGGAGGVKTISARGFGSQHTGISYDGIMLSDCQSGEIDLQRYSPENISSMQLSIGDESNIFLPARNMTSAATLAIETKHETERTAHVTTGSWGFFNPSFNINESISPKTIVGIDADFLHADNRYPFTLQNYMTETREKRANSTVNQGHAELNARIKTATNAMLTAKVYYYDNERELPGAVHYYTNENDEHLRERNAFAQAQYKGRMTEKLSVMINGKFNWATSDYHNGKPSGGMSSAEYWQREYYGSLALLYMPTQWLAFDYSLDCIENNINSSIDASHHNRTSLLQCLAAKLSSHRLTLTGRILRSNYMGEAHRMSPSVAVSYSLTDNLFLRASWKDIFRMPTFNELYFFHLGTQDLRQEKASQWNVGLTWSTPAIHSDVCTWRTAITLDIYYNKVRDKIVSVPINTFVWRTINIGKTDIYGLDATIDTQCRLTARHSIGLTGNYSMQHVENTTNRDRYYRYQTAYVPVHSGSMTLSWLNPWANLSVTSDGMSARWTTNEHTEGTRLPGFMEMSVSMYRTFRLSATTEATLKASLHNVFDKQYDIVVHYPMPGRNFRITGTIKF